MERWIRAYTAEGRHCFLISPSRLPWGNCRECWDTCVDPEAKQACQHPFCHSFYAATLDADELLDRLGQRPDSLLAVRTGTVSHLLVIDIDVKGKHDGTVGIAPWVQRFPEIGTSRVAVTASGGEHIWLTTDEPLQCSASKIAPGVDLRADGGLVVVPPSTTEDGREYRWSTLDAPLTPVLPASGDLIAALRAGRSADRTESRASAGTHPALTQLVGTVSCAGEGERNGLLFWAACRAGEGITLLDWDAGVTIDALTEAAQRCGLHPSEIRRALASGLRQSGVRL